MLYNAPRAASIVANEDCLLWSLDRACFNNIVKESSIKRRERFEKFTKQIDILQDLDPYERNKICDVLQPRTYKAGEYIIKQGEVGNKFYVIEDGEAIATKKKPGKKSKYTSKTTFFTRSNVTQLRLIQALRSSCPFSVFFGDFSLIFD